MRVRELIGRGRKQWCGTEQRKKTERMEEGDE